MRITKCHPEMGRVLRSKAPAKLVSAFRLQGSWSTNKRAPGCDHQIPWHIPKRIEKYVSCKSSVDLYAFINDCCVDSCLFHPLAIWGIAKYLQNLEIWTKINRTGLWLQLIAQIFGISRIFGTAPIVRIRLPRHPALGPGPSQWGGAFIVTKSKSQSGSKSKNGVSSSTDPAEVVSIDPYSYGTNRQFRSIPATYCNTTKSTGLGFSTQPHWSTTESQPR